MEEIWKEVCINGDIFPDYIVSNLGKLKRLERKVSITIKNEDVLKTYPELLLRPTSDRDGYLLINLYRKTYKTHRIVAEAFLPNVENKPVVNHKNGIKSDNRVENLEWATISENIIHALDTNLQHHGEKSVRSKLTNEQVLEIREKLQHEGIKSRDLANMYNVSETTIYSIKYNLKWKRV